MPAPTKSHCEVTHETEPVIIALPHQGIVSRAREAWPGNLGTERSPFGLVGKCPLQQGHFPRSSVRTLHIEHAHSATGRCPWGGNFHTMESPGHERLFPGQGEPSLPARSNA